jgi:hypothetical protein
MNEVNQNPNLNLMGSNNYDPRLNRILIHYMELKSLREKISYEDRFTFVFKQGIIDSISNEMNSILQDVNHSLLHLNKIDGASSHDPS